MSEFDAGQRRCPVYAQPAAWSFEAEPSQPPLVEGGSQWQPAEAGSQPEHQVNATQEPGGGLPGPVPAPLWSFVGAPLEAELAKDVTGAALQAARTTGATVVANKVETSVALRLLGGALKVGSVVGLALMMEPDKGSAKPSTMPPDSPNVPPTDSLDAGVPLVVGLPIGPNGERPVLPGHLPDPGQPGSGWIVVSHHGERPDGTPAVASAGKPPGGDSTKATGTGTGAAPPQEAPEEDGVLSWFKRLLGAGPAPQVKTVSGPSTGSPYPALVPLKADVEVPLAPPRPPFGYSGSYLNLVEQVRASPAMNAEHVQGLLLGHGDYKRVYEFEPEPGWVIKVPQAGDAMPATGRLTAERLLPIAREVVTAERLSNIGIHANTAHGLVRLDFGAGVTSAAYLADTIPGAMLFKSEVGFRLLRNQKLGMPLDWHMNPRALEAINQHTLDSLDLVRERKLQHGFRIDHEQPLLDPATGGLVQQDAQGIVSIDDVYGPLDFAQNLQVRNAVADLLGRPHVAMPDLSQVEFRPWWSGQPSGVALLR